MKLQGDGRVPSEQPSRLPTVAAGMSDVLSQTCDTAQLLADICWVTPVGATHGKQIWGDLPELLTYKNTAGTKLVFSTNIFWESYEKIIETKHQTSHVFIPLATASIKKCIDLGFKNCIDLSIKIRKMHRARVTFPLLLQRAGSTPSSLISLSFLTL